MTTAVENLRAWRETATADDITAGRDWYPLARRVARDMSRHHGVSLDVAAGVIAVLSPRCAWSENLAAADVHPLDALTLDADDPRRDGDPEGRYVQLQAAYSRVAAEFGEDARVTQAIVWCRIRRVWHRADGRRNGIVNGDAIPF